MKSFKILSLLFAIAICTSVSAKAPPGHGGVKESKNTECPYLTALGTTSPSV